MTSDDVGGSPDRREESKIHCNLVHDGDDRTGLAPTILLCSAQSYYFVAHTYQYPHISHVPLSLVKVTDIPNIILSNMNPLRLSAIAFLILSAVSVASVSSDAGNLKRELGGKAGKSAAPAPAAKASKSGCR